MSKLKSLALIALVFFSFNESKASHVSAGEILYECLGNNQYVVTINIYRDCFGISLSTSPQDIFVTDNCGNNLTISAPFIESSEISQLCDADLSNSACNGGSLPGLEVYTFRDTVMLPVCDFVTMSWQLCCRNAAIVNLTNPGGQDFYIETTVNTQDFSCDNSPVFNNLPVPYVCVNVPTTYGFGATEVDGDSLQYTFVSALNGQFSSIPYEPGYSSTDPIPSIVLDPNTGLLTFTASMVGNYVVTVLVSQFDATGDLIGTIMRDMQFVVTTCSNLPPDPTTGVVLTPTNGGSIIDDYSVEICENSGISCFDFSIGDPNGGDSITLSTNLDLVFPGSTFTYNGGNPATGTICIDPSSYQEGFYTFIIQAEDDACPINGFSTYVYSVVLCASPQVIVPNVFSPNGDGVNDGFEFIEIKGFRNYTMQIFNRWGQSIHESVSSTNKKLIWKPSTSVTDGTYFWVFEGTTSSGEVIQESGHLTLLR